MRIAVIGAGYVGLVSAACFAELGHEVITVDNDPRKLAILEAGGVPIHENFLPKLLAQHSSKRLTFSGDISSAVQGAKAVFITVGTPPGFNGDADLSFVESVARQVALALKSKTVVIEKSTVPVRTCEAVRRTMMLSGADPELFAVASNPEFLREGTAVSDFLYPDRIVLGVDDDFSRSVLTEIYRPLTSGEYYKNETAIPGPFNSSARMIITNVKSAELIKHASNAFLAMKISFINTVANVSEAVGADIQQVCEGIGADSRIGPRFLNPGIGYGGSCFPKDVLAFSSITRQCGGDTELLSATMNVNQRQRDRFIEKVREALWNIKGKHLAVLGLAFKGGTDDVRESPAIDIVKRIVQEGATVSVFDPAAMDRARHELQEFPVKYADDPYAASEGADAVLVLTDWHSFRSINLNRVATLLRSPLLIDGRNLFDPNVVSEAGLIYHSIGRRTEDRTALNKAKQPNLADRVPTRLVEV